MNKKIAIYLVVILIIVGAAGYYFLKKETKYDPTVPVVSDGQPGSPTFPIIPDPEDVPPPVMVPEESINPSIQPKPVYTTHFINIEDFKYEKPSVTIKLGDSIVWTNKDSAPHTVTGNTKGGLSSPLLEKGFSYKYTFTSVGTFSYKCVMHPEMTGEVIVTK